MASALDETVKTLVVGSWVRHAEAPRACHAGDWPSFEQRAGEPPGMFAFGERRSYQQCLSLAQSIFTGPIVEEVEIIPLWVGGLPDVDGPTDAWFAVHGVRRKGGPLHVIEPGEHCEDASERVDTRIACELRTWSVGVLVESRRYSPEIALELRSGRWAVSTSEISELIRYDARSEDRALPRPTQEAPPYASWFEPRVAGLSPELIDEIHALSITVDDEGTIIPRAPSTFVTRSDG